MSEVRNEDYIFGYFDNDLYSIEGFKTIAMAVIEGGRNEGQLATNLYIEVEESEPHELWSHLRKFTGVILPSYGSEEIPIIAEGIQVSGINNLAAKGLIFFTHIDDIAVPQRPEHYDVLNPLLEP